MAEPENLREYHVRLATLAEQAENYDYMVKWMETLVVGSIADGSELTAEERNLLSVAFNKSIESLRATWIEQKEGSRKSDKYVVAKIEGELTEMCGRILNLLDSYLILSATSSDSRVYYLKMKADFHKYLAEFKIGDESRQAAENALIAYQAAQVTAREYLLPTHPTRLELNKFSVYYNEIMNPSKLILRNHYVILSPDESTPYTQVENIAKALPHGSRYFQESILNLLLCSSSCRAVYKFHQEEMRLSEKYYDLRKDPDKLQKWNESVEESCPVCYNLTHKLIMLDCDHILCRRCLKIMKRDPADLICPLCRRRIILREDLYWASRIYPAEKYLEILKLDYANEYADMPSKITLLIHLLLSEDAKKKAVIVSQYELLLLVAKEKLTTHGGFKVKFIGECESADDASKRKVAAEFNCEESKKVVLLATVESLITSPHLNLSGASTLYLMEPLWNVSGENKLVDQLLRRCCSGLKVVRLISKNTIEERMLEARRNGDINLGHLLSE